MAGLFDAAVEDVAASEDMTARAATPGSTLAPPAPASSGSPLGSTGFEELPDPANAPAATPARSMFSAAVDDVANDDNARLSGALEMARASDPAKYAEARAIADRDALPMEFVTANLDDLKSRQTANDMRRVLEDTPALKQWFLTGDNANVVKRDDLHKLSGLDHLLASSAAGWSEGWDQRQSADIRYRQIFGRASAAEIARADAADKQEARDFGAEGFFQGAPAAFSKMLPGLLGSTSAGLARASQTAPAGAALGALGAGPAGAAAGFATGAAVGVTAGRLEDNFRQEAGGAYSEFLRIKTDDGAGLDPDIAKAAALIAGMASAGLETIGEAAIERMVPGLDKIGVASLLKGGSREALKEAIKQPSIRAALKAFGGGIAGAMGTEIGTEVAQEGVTLLAGLVAQRVDGGEFQAVEGREVRERLVATATETAQAMLILAPALGSTRLGRDLAVAKRSVDMREMYQQAHDMAGETELRKVAPERYLDAVKSFLGQGKAADTVYVPAGKMTELFQEMGLSPSDLDARIDGFSGRYAEAVATGSDVHIDMAAYQTHIAGTPLGEALIEHQRWHPELETVDEARRAFEAAREQTDAMLEDAVNAAREDAAKAAPRQQVETKVYELLVNIGESPEAARTQAALYGATFGTLGERAGVSPLELFEAQGLDVRRAMPDGLDYRKVDELEIAIDAVRKGDGERARRARARGQGQSLASFLASRGGLVETDSFKGELSSRDLPKGLIGKPDKGLDLDSAALAALEAGYFPDAVTEDGGFDRTGSVEALLAAIDDEVAGRPRYTIEAEAVNIDPSLARIEALADEMAILGLDPASMTNDEIRAELMRSSSPDALNGALFQTAGRPDLAGDRGDKRGSIQFGDGSTIINLFRAANLSTFLHESGHLFYEVMQQVGGREGAPDQLATDLATLHAFTGAEVGKPISREAHEKFAKAFETYLSEGRAPSPDLAGVFERFKSWLMFVYRGAARAIGLPAIPAEIRDVFDRMLATDEEIADIAKDPSFRPVFKDAAAAGMTELQWSRYQASAQNATDAAKGELLAKLVGEKKREQTREWKAAKEATREEVFADLATRPVYQVQHYIRTGEILNGDGVVPIDLAVRRLDRQWLVNRFGAGVLSRLPRQVPPVYTDKGGLDPDEVAEWFGFTSGEHMVGEMLSAPSFARALNARVDELMRERNGDLMSNQAAMTEAATQAFNNDERGVFLETELKALASKAKGSPGNPMPRQQARATARELIRGKVAAEAGRVAVYARARDKAAREAERAVLTGDFAAATDAKRRQLFHHFMTQEATAARDEAEATRRYLDKFASRKRPPGVDPEYLDQIEGLLERFEFKRSTSLTAINRRKSLSAFVREREDAGDAFAIPEDLLTDARLVSYKDMTMLDLAALRDVVKNLEHLGRLKGQLLNKGRRISFEKARDELVLQARRTPKKKGIKGRNPTDWERMKGTVAGLDAWLLKMQTVFDWLDLGDVNGPFQRLIWQKFVDAQNKKGELQKEFADKIQAIMTGMPKGYLAEKKSVPARPELMFTRSELFAIALNQGTESNRNKLLKGETVSRLEGRSFNNEVEMNSALSLLSKEDWDRVQSLWDLLEGMWPETAALEKRISGVEPPRLERREVITAFGTYRGGYYPMVYDPLVSGDVARRAEEEADKKFDNVYSRPAVAHGFTKARVEGYSRPVLLDLRALTSHIDGVIHNLTHREAVRDTLKLIADPTLELALTETMGREVYGEMNKWLDRIAKDRGDPPADTVAANILRQAKTNISVYAMGFRLTTALSQFAGFANSVEVVKPSFLGAAMIHSTRHPREAWALVQSKSGQMRDRVNNMDRDIRAALRALEGKDGMLDGAKRYAFILVAMADRVVTVPTWLGAYNQHMATYPGDEAGGVRAGDRAVDLSQGSGATKDLSSIMGNQGGAFQFMTLFYSYFNTYYNRLRSLGRDTRTMFADGEYEDLPHLLARSVALVILPALMADLLVGKWPEEDENVAWWALRKSALYPFMSVPLARDIASSLDSGMDYSLSPIARFGELAVKLTKDGQNVISGEGVEGRLVAKRAAELAGYTFGLPLGQAVGIGSNVWQGMEQGDLKAKDILFSRRSFGDTRDQ